MRDFPVEVVACFVGLVLIALFAHILFRKLRFPCTVGLVFVGMLLFKLGGVFEPLNVLQRVHLTPNFILYILLPTLIFDAAINLDARELWRNIVPISYLAIPGVLVTAAVVGLLVAKFTPLGLNAAMLFGALISTTDTAAVIALFNELNAPKRLAMLMDGESLFNDATAIVLFDIIAAIVAGSLLLANPAEAWTLNTLAGIPGKFLLVFFGGGLVGAAVGWLLMQVIRFSHHDPLLEVGLTTVVAYAAFILANHYCKFSGVMAACGAGLVVNYYGRGILAENMLGTIRKFWAFAAFMANSLIFLLLGLTESFLIQDLGRLRHVAGAVGVAILAVLLARALILGLTAACYHPFAKPEKKLSWPVLFVMWWGGLRGALPIALAVSIGPALVPPAERTLVIQLTLGIILFTMLI
jgi:CPA1 family monovalent cation:H+ antiporter